MHATDSTPPSLSFIGIVDFTQDARWLYMTDSVTDLLGYEPTELYGRPSLELVHPDEYVRVRQLHYDTIAQDKAAVLVYLRMRHKDPYKGYILVGVTRTVVHNVLIGSVSYASPGAKALHNAATAREITVIAPNAEGLDIKRWGDPSPMPPSPVPPEMDIPRRSKSPSRSPKSARSSSRDSERSTLRDRDSPPSTSASSVITFDPLPSQSSRTAFILDRFSSSCTIMYCSNDLLLSSENALFKSFFDFVSKKDENIVRTWIDAIKTWGVNERGQPSDGGFGFGRFSLLPQGRDSNSRVPEPPPSRHGHGPRHPTNQQRRDQRTRGGRVNNPSNTSSRVRPIEEREKLPNAEAEDSLIPVDAIFSAHSDGMIVILRRAV